MTQEQVPEQTKANVAAYLAVHEAGRLAVSLREMAEATPEHKAYTASVGHLMALSLQFGIPVDLQQITGVATMNEDRAESLRTRAQAQQGRQGPDETVHAPSAEAAAWAARPVPAEEEARDSAFAIAKAQEGEAEAVSPETPGAEA